MRRHVIAVTTNCTLSRLLSDSCSSSQYLCLFPSISTASQDSVGSLLGRSGSGIRGTSTWAHPVADSAPQAHPCSTSSSAPSLNPGPAVASATPAACGPPALPKATGSAPNPSPIRIPSLKQSSDQCQLKPILEAPPDSPKAFVTATSPFKREFMCV